MRELFADVPEACDNTLEIVKRIDLKIPEKIFYLPDYPVPKTRPTTSPACWPDARRGSRIDAAPDRVVEMGADEYLRSDLRARSRRALRRRPRRRTIRCCASGSSTSSSVIVKMGFSSYFLIVWDFIKYARDRDIPVGPGRGSAVGSIVSYCLRITDLDPIKFKLIFERFLNPERISMPDIDTDFCVERRDEVIDVRHRKVRQGSRRADRHVRNDGRPRGDPRRRTRAGRAAPRRRPGRQAHPVRSGRSVDHSRARTDPRTEDALRRQSADPQAARHRELDRRAGAPRLHARGRRRDLQEPAHRSRAAGAARRGRRQHAVRHEHGRAGRPARRWTSSACATSP